MRGRSLAFIVIAVAAAGAAVDPHRGAVLRNFATPISTATALKG